MPLAPPDPVIQSVAVARPELACDMARAVIGSETPEIRATVGSLIDATRVAAQAFIAFGKHGIPFDALTDLDIGSILDELVNVAKLERFTTRFVAEASKRCPAATVGLLMRRIERQHTHPIPGRAKPQEYKALPHQHRQEQLRLPPEHPDTLPTLISVRDAWSAGDPLAQMYLAELMRMACSSTALAFATVEDWLASGDTGRIVEGAKLLGQALGVSDLLREPQAIARSLLRARQASPDCLAEVRARLGQEPIGIAVASGRGEDADPASPIARHCEALLPDFADDPDMQRFLRDAAERAQQLHVWIHQRELSTDEDE